MIRKALISDAKAIHKLLMGYAKDGQMLPRSLSEIYENIRDIYVYEDQGAVVGTVCLTICWEDLAEVRSLAVAAGHFGQGIGRQLVEACLEEARRFSLRRVFALTYQRDFFTRLGFYEIEKSELPHKIWSDCLKCAKFPDCDEIAVCIDL
ncbi:N-acetylglutamate synthase [Geoalkalibacter ferrihydriticus]|uniref:Acetyltransferase n=2 Tax=Geoalkalibacter ferrihydriticus TaxID=392333 RepID=A0A0C2HPG4_9BACT|nr:N-acetyltransferase [Geoalkalibacter ferrihydriticus]KIH76825.1 acetyltransferase [Geoalkalibacter ferrihydriticus DSM 17813]SDL49016.1 N-acetylglutamate synthase [Geoalkalibacter ferrihydriticus]